MTDAKRPRPGSKGADICDLALKHPDWDAGQIAQKLGIDKQSVWNVLSKWRGEGYLPKPGEPPRPVPTGPAPGASSKASDRIKLAVQIWNETGDYDRVAERLGVTTDGARIMINGARRQGNIDVLPDDVDPADLKPAAGTPAPADPVAERQAEKLRESPAASPKTPKQKRGYKKRAKAKAGITVDVTKVKKLLVDAFPTGTNSLTADDLRELTGLVEKELLAWACDADTGAIDTIVERLSRLAALRAKLKTMA